MALERRLLLAEERQRRTDAEARPASILFLFIHCYYNCYYL